MNPMQTERENKQEKSKARGAVYVLSLVIGFAGLIIALISVFSGPDSDNAPEFTEWTPTSTASQPATPASE